MKPPYAIQHVIWQYNITTYTLYPGVKCGIDYTLPPSSALTSGSPRRCDGYTDCLGVRDLTSWTLPLTSCAGPLAAALLPCHPCPPKPFIHFFPTRAFSRVFRLLLTPKQEYISRISLHVWFSFRLCGVCVCVCTCVCLCLLLNMVLWVTAYPCNDLNACFSYAIRLSAQACVDAHIEMQLLWAAINVVDRGT